MLQHLNPLSTLQPRPLFGARSSRLLEGAALAQLPPHTLMKRAAQSIFDLGRALYPHAKRVWVACGSGNNGGDGLLAAALWHTHGNTVGTQVYVTWTGHEEQLPDDARFALQTAREAGVHFVDQPPADIDLAIDALLGLGTSKRTRGQLADWVTRLQRGEHPVLCVDLPSGLNPDTGEWLNDCPVTPQGPRHTLALVTLKPGQFTGQGREACGDLWWDSLGCEQHAPTTLQADAFLSPASTPCDRKHRHSGHKGVHGDLYILGGQDVRLSGQGMTGAALLAARAGACAGAGRVLVGLLGASPSSTLGVDMLFPELMFRQSSDLLEPTALSHATTVCGCGGGLAVRECLPVVLEHSQRLVLDADALNAIAENDAWKHSLRQRHTRQQVTVLTPHPLEAARLLKTDSQSVQKDRLTAAQTLASEYQCIVVLKGSGTVLAAPGVVPWINPTGNALLATAGTGDVLAGLIGANLCSTPWPSETELHTQHALALAAQAVYRHGLAATEWRGTGPMTASDLVQRLKST